MAQSLRCTGFVPPGFVVIEAADAGLAVQITVRSTAAFSPCPVCGGHSFRVHSRYQRLPLDLPLSGRNVHLHLQARRFHCDVPTCRRRIFAERFDPDVLKPWARRTARLDDVVHHLGLALGGRPAARLARRLMVPITKDTPLRTMRRHGRPAFLPPSAIGIDDWAWRRNQRYGTLICDLDRHRTIALLPNREPASAEEWLLDQPQITIVARDRSGAYAQAASNALPHAVQVADRWHLMENASHAFLDAVRKSMRQIRAAIGAATVDPALLTAAERIQYEGYLRREEINGAILALAKEGVAIKEIVRRTGLSRKLVRKVVRGLRSDIFRIRESSLDLHLPWLDAQWAAGQHNATDLWCRLRRSGFRGSLRVVGEWATRRQRSDQAQTGEHSRTPAARTIARLLTIGWDALTKAETVTVAAIEGGVPLLVEAREIVAAFQSMIRKKTAEELEPWLQRAKASLVASFANGVAKDRNAVIAAITLPWSNGQTEGQITKLKLVKRQMYGRGKLDILQARVIGPG